MIWMLQIRLICLIGVESNIETDVVVRVDHGSAEIPVLATEVGGDPGDRGQIPIAVSNEIVDILGGLELEEDHMVDSGGPSTGRTPDHEGQCQKTGAQKVYP